MKMIIKFFIWQNSGLIGSKCKKLGTLGIVKKLAQCKKRGIAK
jgi:hypothetical protein